jgi:hypothetical protein
MAGVIFTVPKPYLKYFQTNTSNSIEGQKVKTGLTAPTQFPSLKILNYRTLNGINLDFGDEERLTPVSTRPACLTRRMSEMPPIIKHASQIGN